MPRIFPGRLIKIQYILEKTMNNLDQVLTEMDFNFLGTGEHSMSIDAFRKVLGNKHFFFLDVRTEEELQYLNFPFATHIPLHKLPARIGDLPKDKCIVPFCSSIFRAAVVYTFLRANDFEEVRALTSTTEELASVLKPGPLSKMLS
jgi:rhodanese-related sulfurtransferase